MTIKEIAHDLADRLRKDPDFEVNEGEIARTLEDVVRDAGTLRPSVSEGDYLAAFGLDSHHPTA